MDIRTYIARFRQLTHLQGLDDEQTEACISYARNLFQNGLPVIYDQEHFAHLVGYDYSFILSLSNVPQLYYKQFHISKKNGGTRTIDEPYPSLKEMQTWILDNILTPASKQFVSPVAKAFVPGKSLRDNAKFHKNKKQVVALDIQDFFGSIHFGAVYGAFEKMGYSTSVSTLLTRLCLLKNSLPQGAPTSPMLSNIVFKCIDDGIFHYCSARGIMYTRYADDMVFSSDDMDISRLIAYVKMRVENFKMHINEKKTKVMGRGSRQNVTGVVVNDKLQVSRDYRMKIRQEMHFVLKYGLIDHFARVKDIPSWVKNPIHYAKHLYGKVCFVLQINPKDNVFMFYKMWLKEQIVQWRQLCQQEE